MESFRFIGPPEVADLTPPLTLDLLLIETAYRLSKSSTSEAGIDPLR